ncbi:MAG: signal peptidase [Pseudonocardiales bacterium]|nr:signal peptidase [Pseudonocardiales bacterium]
MTDESETGASTPSGPASPGNSGGLPPAAARGAAESSASNAPSGPPPGTPVGDPAGAGPPASTTPSLGTGPSLSKGPRHAAGPNSRAGATPAVAPGAEPSSAAASVPPLGTPGPGEPAADGAPVPPPGETRRQRRKRQKAEKPHRKAPWWELPALVLLAIGIAILVKTFVVQPFYIPSASMEKTLHGCPGCQGDRILVNKPIYDLRDPHGGDIVVFNAPPGWNNEPTSKPPSNPVVRTIRGFGQLIGFVPPDGQVLVKRVIATGGQTVKGDAQGHVMIGTQGPNGPFRTLNEPYVYAPAGDQGQVSFGPVTVPKGRLWVMGDHRTDSADSRYHCTAGGPEGTANDSTCDPTASTVPVGDVIGKAFVIAWPPSRWSTLGTPSTFKNAALAAGPALPTAASMATVLPIFVIRRRRRRR